MNTKQRTRRRRQLRQRPASKVQLVLSYRVDCRTDRVELEQIVQNAVTQMLERLKPD